MKNILREAEKAFRHVRKILTSTAIRDGAYFGHLNDATLDAYVAVNEGMCIHSDVCRECAEHRDFLRLMLDILENLTLGNLPSKADEEQLNTYLARVNDIIQKISASLASF